MESYFRQLLCNQSWLFEQLIIAHDKLTTEYNSIFKNIQDLYNEQNESNHYDLQLMEETLISVAKDMDNVINKKSKTLEYSQRLLLDISAIKHSIFICNTPDSY